MALLLSPNCRICHEAQSPSNPNLKFNRSKFSVQFPANRSSFSFSTGDWKSPRRLCIFRTSGEDPAPGGLDDDEEVNDLGVKAALSMLRFYKREISPLLPKSCRYVPTCSEYSMIAYKKYGVVKGTILTAWRLCRCNPLGGSGFDPPRWFDEATPPEQ